MHFYYEWSLSSLNNIFTGMIKHQTAIFATLITISIYFTLVGSRPHHHQVSLLSHL